jgi:hypothetical protein
MSYYEDDDQYQDIEEYTVERKTQFKRYWAVVQVDYTEGIQSIFLYDQDPHKLLLGFIPRKMEPIDTLTGNRLLEVNRAITRMITSHEFMIYQRWLVENGERFLDIDYAHEMYKQKQKLLPPSERELIELEEVQAREPIAVTEYINGQQVTYTITLDGSDQVQEVANRTGMSESSLRNLIQYRNKK